MSILSLFGQCANGGGLRVRPPLPNFTIVECKKEFSLKKPTNYGP